MNIHMIYPLLIAGLGLQEILFVTLLVLFLFGGKKIPEMMKGLGLGVKSFKEAMQGTAPDAPQKAPDEENRSPLKDQETASS